MKNEAPQNVKIIFFILFFIRNSEQHRGDHVIRISIIQDQYCALCAQSNTEFRRDITHQMKHSCLSYKHSINHICPSITLTIQTNSKLKTVFFFCKRIEKDIMSKIKSVSNSKRIEFMYSSNFKNKHDTFKSNMERKKT